MMAGLAVAATLGMLMTGCTNQPASSGDSGDTPTAETQPAVQDDSEYGIGIGIGIGFGVG